MLELRVYIIFYLDCYIVSNAHNTIACCRFIVCYLAVFCHHHHRHSRHFVHVTWRLFSVLSVLSCFCLYCSVLLYATSQGE